MIMIHDYNTLRLKFENDNKIFEKYKEINKSIHKDSYNITQKDLIVVFNFSFYTHTGPHHREWPALGDRTGSFHETVAVFKIPTVID